MGFLQFFGIKPKPKEVFTCDPPRDPVFCRDCTRCRRDQWGGYEHARCDMGEQLFRERQDFTSGEMKTIPLKDRRRFCADKNFDGQCTDFVARSK